MDSLCENEAVEIVNSSGAGDFVIICEHASNFIPENLEGLGLSEHQLLSHIAFDAGALEVAQILSAELDAPLVAAKISRLVYDCNREPGVASAIVAESDGLTIPGNAGLSKADRASRALRVYQPFFACLKDCLARRDKRQQASIIVSVHSFTPIMNGIKRYLDIGVLHDADARLADQIMSIAHADGALRVRRNEPYSADDEVTHTLKEHGVSSGRLNVMLEIRNDLLIDAQAQSAIALRLSNWISKARDKILQG